MARLRSPTGCPWDREQSHMTLRRHAIEEVYELIDAIEARDDHEMAEELGDLLLQVVFHCQLARERGAFDFEKVCRLIVEKLDPPASACFRQDKGQGRGRSLGKLGKNQARRKTRNKTCPAFRLRRHTQTSARPAARGKARQESAEGLWRQPPIIWAVDQIRLGQTALRLDGAGAGPGLVGGGNVVQRNEEARKWLSPPGKELSRVLSVVDIPRNQREVRVLNP